MSESIAKNKREIPANAKPIPGYPGYFAQEDGSIWGLQCKRLKPYLRSDGYTMVSMTNGKRVQTHTLILMTFIGPCPEGEECRHKDNAPANNALSNLEWAPHAINMDDQIKFETRRMGEFNHQAKLTEEQVREIYALKHRFGDEVAKRYGMERSAIGNIWRRETWKHLNLPAIQKVYGRNHKLTEAEARQIFELKDHKNLKELAQQFGVHHEYIRSLLTGKAPAWKALQWEYAPETQFIPELQSA